MDQAIQHGQRYKRESVFDVVGFNAVGVPEERPVGELEQGDNQYEPATPDRDSRGVPDHVRVEAHERRPAHPEDAGGCPDWMKAPASARHLRHLLSCMRVKTWSATAVWL